MIALFQGIPSSINSWWAVVSAIGGALVGGGLIIWRSSRYFSKLESFETKAQEYSDTACKEMNEKYEEDYEAAKLAIEILRNELNGLGERVNRLSDTSLHHQDKFVIFDKEILNLKNVDDLTRKDIGHQRDDIRQVIVRADKLTDSITSVRIELARKGIETKSNLD